MNRYHAETFSLAGWELRDSVAAADRVATLEHTLGRRVPTALRELLVSDCWPRFLAHFSSCDHPIGVTELLDSRWPGYSPLEHGLLPFMIENQGVCTWAIKLDSSDDPEVLVEVDSGNPPTWQHAAPCFSTWLQCQVLDHQLLENALFAAQAEPLAEQALARLERSFVPGPRTFAWPGRTVHRFRNDLGSILLWAADDQCDWWIAPANLDAAARFLDDLPLSAGFDGWLYELQPEGKPVLETWRRPTSR